MGIKGRRPGFCQRCWQKELTRFDRAPILQIMNQERLTWPEMKSRYPNEWLLIVDFQSDDLGRFLSGIVAHHSTDMEEIAIHASAIRNAFFDNRKQMDDVIPPVLLVTLDDRVEISPRKTKRVPAAEKKANTSKKKQKKTSPSNP